MFYPSKKASVSTVSGRNKNDYHRENLPLSDSNETCLAFAEPSGQTRPRMFVIVSDPRFKVTTETQSTRHGGWRRGTGAASCGDVESSILEQCPLFALLD